MSNRTNLTARVSRWNGSPTLFINDKPDTGLMLYHNDVRVGGKEIGDFAAAGIDLITTGLGSTSCLLPDGSIEVQNIDRTMETILAANPRALVLARLMLAPPTWWVEKNPGEMMIHRDPFLNEDVRGEYKSVSFASEIWRREMRSALRLVIRHLEGKWGSHLLGYHLAGGECGEWSYIWRHYTQSDYSQPQQSTFRRWLARQYQGDESRFRESWGNTKIDEAQIPTDWRWSEGLPETLARKEDGPLRDYLAFHSDVVADAILYFARATKDELRQIGSEKVVAVFYGYHFTPPGQPSAFTDSGHHALHRILAASEVDILCAPYSYHGREAGGYYYSQLVTGSARLHGKLVYSEDDTVTHVVPPHPHRYQCPDGWTSRQVIQRNILGALRDGGTAWYMDWFGQNWYNDEELLASFKATQDFARRRLEWDTSSVAEVAVLASSGTAHRLRPLAPALVPWVLESVANLHRLGAPLDIFLLEDLPKVLAGEGGERYRLFVFLDVIDPDEKEREAISLAEQSGKTLVWTHPIGWEPAGKGLRESLPIASEDFRQMAREAGVHLYSDAGDFVVAEKNWLAVHAATDGARKIHLPANKRAMGLSDVEIGEGGQTFSTKLRAGETRVWTFFD